MPRTIIYMFAGRQENVELSLPFYRRILEQNPDTELHIWDLARNRADSRYLRTITGDHITVRTEFYNPHDSAGGQNKVWRHYATPDYDGCLFVKTDDDLGFIETDPFHGFVQAAQDNPDKTISALTVNHGASTPLIPDLWAMFTTLNIPLLDVHLSAKYAEACHRWFHTNWQTLVGQPHELVPATTWASINYIAYSYDMGCKIAAAIGTKSPPMIADREFPRRNARGRLSGHRVGDEGAVNLFPVLIDKGTVAAHLTFSPQVQSTDHPHGMTPELLTELRKLYADVGRQYLA